MSKSTVKTATRKLNTKVHVSNAGVISVRSSDIVQSEEGKRQIEALGKIVKKNKQTLNK